MKCEATGLRSVMAAAPLREGGFMEDISRAAEPYVAECLPDGNARALSMRAACADFRGSYFLEGAGHWV